MMQRLSGVAQSLLKCLNSQCPVAQGPHWPVRIMPGDAHVLDPASSSKRSVVVTQWHGRGTDDGKAANSALPSSAH